MHGELSDDGKWIWNGSEWKPFVPPEIPAPPTKSSPQQPAFISENEGRANYNWTMVTHRGELIPLITDENRLYYWIDDEKHILHKPIESCPPASFRPTMAVLPPSRPPPSDSPVYSNTISTHKQTGEVTHEISGKKKHHIWWLSETVLGWLWKGAVVAAGVKIMLGKKSNMTDPVSGRSCYNCGPYEGGDPIFGVLFILIGAVILPQVLKWFIGLFQDE